MADLKNLKGISEKDRKMIADAEQMLGPDPSEMGFIKNLFWGNFREDLVFPYPESAAEETARCDQLLARLDEYMRNEHPSVQIDQEQEIPRWVIDRLFEMGVLGMTIPREHGGGGLGITSYNRVLERIGASCGSTAVLVSAHQSIGCKAVMLFGTDEQKKNWLPKLATEWVSAFCLSEPNVGCDAGGQETRCEWNEAEQCYILNGEKKWATSGAISGLFTVMAKQKMPDGKDKVTALVCTPDMPGIDIFQKNRSKCGIRGTWQARIRFTNVRVPKAHLMHKEGRGLNVALTCLNYGRCTLSAGMLGGAKAAMDQAIKWSQTRYQFQRPLADFELVQQKVARMAAYTYAMESMLYMTTGMLDRHDDDIMLETAICKVFCSEYGWRTVNDAMQIMGGESYMTENQIERIFRDSRINIIVEGANEVMQSFIFAYGGKQLAEQMVGVRDAMAWNKEQGVGANLARVLRNGTNPVIVGKAIPLGLELFLGIKRAAPQVTKLHASLASQGDRVGQLTRDLSHAFKKMSKVHEENLLNRQVVQARIADCAIMIHAMTCSLSRLDRDLRAGAEGVEFERDRAACMHFCDMAEVEFRRLMRELTSNADASMARASEAALKLSDTLPNSQFSIPERSPVAKGTGRELNQQGIKQFPGTRFEGDPTFHGSGGTSSGSGVSAVEKLH
ncbi:MAG: acyl-CoA dehydrogenase family protein [Phycisphaeraceae bacterium]|nr:acyl-CoA dehydrogenase family protein [Phycisphaeraceae bacterium]